MGPAPRGGPTKKALSHRIGTLSQRIGFRFPARLDSLQAKLERRFQDGVALSLGYTWSKAMALNFAGTWGQWFGATEYERHILKAPMKHDRPQTFYSSAIWQLPFFRSGSGLRRTLLGGWEATSIVTLTSGSTYWMWDGRDLWNQGPRAAPRPDWIGDGNLGEAERSVDRWFDTSAFVAPVYDSSLCQGADTCHEAARRALGNRWTPRAGRGFWEQKDCSYRGAARTAWWIAGQRSAAADGTVRVPPLIPRS